MPRIRVVVNRVGCHRSGVYWCLAAFWIPVSILRHPQQEWRDVPGFQGRNRRPQGLVGWVAGASESAKEVDKERTGFSQVYDGEITRAESFRGSSVESDKKPDLLYGTPLNDHHLGPVRSASWKPDRLHPSSMVRNLQRRILNRLQVRRSTGIRRTDSKMIRSDNFDEPCRRSWKMIGISRRTAPARQAA